MRRTLAVLLAATALVLSALVLAPTTAQPGAVPRAAPTLPALPTSPTGDPPGANQWSCQPTKARPTPVILVHGTFGDRATLLQRLSARVKRAGFCVYSLDYGNRGTGDIAASARQLKRFTQRVLRATGAAEVSMVGHSQGGMMPRHYIKFLGGKRVVDDLVGLAPSNHGTRLTDRGTNPIRDLVPGLVCRACTQQATSSPFLRRLNAGDETPGRVSYTNVTTRLDEVVIPHTSGYLAGPRTTNVTLQAECPLALNEHLTIPLSRAAIDIALDALTHEGPARPGFQPSCLP